MDSVSFLLSLEHQHIVGTQSLSIELMDEVQMRSEARGRHGGGFQGSPLGDAI